MVKRTDNARFMSGAWVFPGGAVDDTDSGRDDLSPHHAAAVRELVEETGIVVDGSSLTYFANWVTPAPLPVRFDTRFYAVEVPPSVEAVVDGEELVDAAWIGPAQALERADAGDWLVAFPTRKTLEAFSGHDSAVALLASLPTDVEAIQPRLSVEDNAVRILLPTDPGFDDADEDDPGLLDRVVAVARAGGEVPAEMRRP